MKIGVIGCGYLGSVVAACFAARGHEVLCYDPRYAAARGPLGIDSLLFEPGVRALAESAGARLAFTASFADLPAWSQVHYVCAAAPPGDDGLIDTANLFAVARELAAAPGLRLFVKSTVPVGTTRRLQAELRAPDARAIFEPEFTSEGSAVADFLEGAYRVFGADGIDALRPLIEEIYRPLDAGREVEHCFMGLESAELSKLSLNSMLACRLSFVNELANYTRACGADIDAVAGVLRADPRIGPLYLKPGPGFGGACLPKDSLSLCRQMEAASGAHMLRAIVAANARQRDILFDLLRARFAKFDGLEIALLGLAFKAGTDDTRGSPALRLIEQLRAVGGARLRAYDPLIQLADVLGDELAAADVRQEDDPYAAAAGADAVALCTDAPELVALDLPRLAGVVRARNLFDSRNALDPAKAAAAGFHYVAIGGRGGAD